MLGGVQPIIERVIQTCFWSALDLRLPSFEVDISIVYSILYWPRDWASWAWDVEMYQYVVVRLSHFADVYIIDWVRGGTLSSVIDDHVMTWPLHPVTATCCFAIIIQYLPSCYCKSVGWVPTINCGRAPCIYYLVHKRRKGWWKTSDYISRMDIFGGIEKSDGRQASLAICDWILLHC